MFKNDVFAKIVVMQIMTRLILAFEIHLSPDPNVLAVGHRPVGVPFAILCIVTGLDNSTKPGIVWTKTRSNISHQTFRTGNVELKQIDAFTLGLHIQNSTIEDSGIYVCTASVNNETRSVTVDVNIFEELQFVEDINKIESPIDGSSFNISCRVQLSISTSNLITMWEKGIIALTNVSYSNSYKFLENNQVLQIQNYNSSEHEGDYHCKVYDKRTGSVITKQFHIGGIQKKRLEFCSHLCSTLCTNLYNGRLVDFGEISQRIQQNSKP